ncbi:MAG: LysR substrate-binding domain-containing protein, partial [Geminicoccaceae bacterium]
LRIETSSHCVDLRHDKIDAAIRHGLGRYPGCSSTLLAAPKLIPVCSPELLERGEQLHSPVDCLHYPLLHDAAGMDWPLWFQAHGVAEASASEGPRYSEGHLLLNAAIAGQGIALLHDLYAYDALHSGRLRLAIDLPWPSEFAYHFVTLEKRAKERKIVAFRDWLLEEISNSNHDHANPTQRTSSAEPQRQLDSTI